MTLDRALLEDVATSTREVARIVGSYRKELVDQGMAEVEAWTLAQRLEERLLGPLFQSAERELSPAPWADVEALFLAVVNLQLVLGHAPNACAAVRYMIGAGVRLRALTSAEAQLLAARSSIDAHAVAAAFTLHAVT